MTDDHRPIEHQMIATATAIDFEVVDTKIEPTVGNEDSVVRMTLQLQDEDVEFAGIPIIYVLGLLSFHDGRPRGYSGKFFEDDDEWSSSDMLRHLRFERGCLRFYADYVRGRCVKTRIEVTAEGNVYLETVNRGESATRWIDQLRGKTYLRPVN